jgi:hypothetical protein
MVSALASRVVVAQVEATRRGMKQLRVSAPLPAGATLVGLAGLEYAVPADLALIARRVLRRRKGAFRTTLRGDGDAPGTTVGKRRKDRVRMPTTDWTVTGQDRAAATSTSATAPQNRRSLGRLHTRGFLS